VDLRPDHRVSLEIRELPRKRFRFRVLACRVDAAGATRELAEVSRADYSTEAEMWRHLADYAADRQAESALAAADARRLP
jgi:hypothetical protein